jgi:hypothetical protein
MMERSNVQTVVAFAIVLLVLLLFVPLLWLAFVVYVMFLVALAWSAVRYRHSGWVSGLVFVGLSASIPVWVFAGYGLYCWFAETLGLTVGQPR